MDDVTKERFKALNKLADYLARRDHSELELKQKLAKFFPSDVISWALTEASEQGWLTDPKELAERVAASLQRKKKGAKYIQRYLQEKGLPAADTDPERDRENAELLVEQKYGKMSELSYAEKQKVFNFLYRRGFEEATIRDIVFKSAT